mmetsp:Transcript_28691/g.25705  ORF Transcript_28691/g.25705 Transcript_28691/m.25705 type:complete len:185 (-) Transcript_28691:2691-3245(-)
MTLLLDEMYERNKDRKNGLFTVSVFFDETSKTNMIYTPSQDEIKTCLEGVLEEMIRTVRDVGRIINHPNYDNVMKKRFIPDIEEIIRGGFNIKGSREYIYVLEEIREKVTKDFAIAEKHVDSKFNECREISEKCRVWDLVAYEGEDHTISEIREFHNQLRQWEENIHRYLSETKKGIIWIEGSK